MLSVERLRRIKDYLLEYKQADVSTLSVMLSVSEPTIRKDLERLESDGIIIRFHGGALLKEDSEKGLVAVQEGIDPLLMEKRQIADLSMQLINDGEVVFLGHGTTCYQIAKMLREKQRISVITNNVHILYELAGLDNIDLVIVGGNVRKTRGDISICGSFPISMLDNILINKAFVSPAGVSLRHGFTVSSNDHLAFYKKVREVSGELIFVADYTKFDNTSMIPFLPLKADVTVIANENIPAEYKAFFFDAGMPLFTTIGLSEIIKR